MTYLGGLLLPDTREIKRKEGTARCRMLPGGSLSLSPKCARQEATGEFDLHYCFRFLVWNFLPQFRLNARERARARVNSHLFLDVREMTLRHMKTCPQEQAEFRVRVVLTRKRPLMKT